jgi:5-formyltetrahydrofolate cyclo-ligase
MTLSKKEIRNGIIKNRDMLDQVAKMDMDNEIFDKFVKSDFYKKAKVIFAFVSFGSEVDTKKIIEYSIKDNKIICVPRVKSMEEGFDIYRIRSLEDLEPGFYGILEPKASCERIDYESIDFILMPGVAFDRAGGRIGYGGGFYDRYLSKLNKAIPQIAIAYSLQIVDEIPMDLHDMSIGGIITEQEIIYF